MTLTGEVLHAFERACAEGDYAVAEKLLQALELMDARELDATSPQRPLTRAYLAVAGLQPPAVCGSKCQRRH